MSSLWRLYPALWILFLTARLVATPAAAQDSERFYGHTDDDDGAGVRIEYEAKLKVPLAQMEEVWEWLRARYADCSWLNQEDQVFRATFGDEHFTDTYFDTPDLQLLAEESGVRHRMRVVHAGPARDKDGRQLLQVKLNRGDTTGLARSEIKFTVSPSRRPKTRDDLHPMLGLIKKSEREECKAVFSGLGLDPYLMRPILTLEQSRRRVYLNDQKGAFATLTLDLCSTRSWKTNLIWGEIELELNEIRYTEVGDADRQKMVRIIEAVQDDILRAFPAVTQDQTPKYNTSFMAIEAATWLPLRRLIRWNINDNRFIAMILAGAASVCGGIWYGGLRWRRRGAPRGKGV